MDIEKIKELYGPDTEIRKLEGIQIETPDGFKDVSYIKRIKVSGYYTVKLSNGDLIEASGNHRVQLGDGHWSYINELEKGTILGEGTTVLEDPKWVEEECYLYDFLDVEGSVYLTCNGVVNHNCAFIENIEETYAAAQQTQATGGQSLLLSTPNGVGNFFYKTWVKAENGENTFFPIRLPWTVHPERNQEWRDKQDRDLGRRFASQECDTNFLTSGNTVIEPELLNEIEKETVKEPDDKRGFDGNLWIWLEPDYTRNYLITADVARGDGEDFSACHVFDVETCEQVAEYRGQLGPRDYGRFLFKLGHLYNDALTSVENASIGWSTIEELIESGYPNLYYGTTNPYETVENYNIKWEKDKLTPGFSNTARTRPILVAKIIEYLEGKSCILHSKRLLSELRTFIWGSGGKAEAAQGFHDDLVMAFGQALYIRDTALRMRQKGRDLTKNSLDSFLNLNKRDSGIFQIQRVDDPYKMNLGDGRQEDFSWLLG